jgi:hypothetical protein
VAKELRERDTVSGTIGDRFLKKIDEPEKIADHMGKIPGSTYRRSVR